MNAKRRTRGLATRTGAERRGVEGERWCGEKERRKKKGRGGEGEGEGEGDGNGGGIPV